MKLKRVFYFGVLLFIFSACGSHKSQTYYDYKTTLIGSELDGSYTLRSWGRARNAADAYVQAHKQAVFDIIFTGVQPASGNLQALKPLLLEVNAREKYQDYFDVFFADNGPFTKFSSIKEKRVFTTRYDRTQAQTVSETTVCVWRAKLRQKLIEDNILKLNNY
ncbi:MAG TPA: hypothetical protein PK984_00095 [Paludibacteraceae bacterium]|jgi:hypothetical protein|nr:MAG: hypothetical protein BWX63_02186 [Bacteroidetes bacterium ADurb.Bin041]HOG35747.1 hypothetical protein [Paludibacteraceae bacterium]HOH71491.1 hypothetical protein [Paludibacteraceae bacterium]HOS36601.1 hypothetical protein [Paludibacteraceae bacterium]HPK19772.1 hypothetical protein [Paludibacteraceae bacterium]